MGGLPKQGRRSRFNEPRAKEEGAVFRVGIENEAGSTETVAAKADQGETDLPLAQGEAPEGGSADVTHPATTAFSLKDAVAAIRDVLVITAGLVVPIGYTYRNAYFDELTVPQHATTSDLNEVLYYAALVFEKSFLIVLLYLVLVGSVLWALRRYLRKRGASPITARSVLGATIIMGALALVYLGQLIAQVGGALDAKREKQNGATRWSTFLLASTAAQGLQKKLDSLDKELHIVEESKDEFFVLVTPKDQAMPSTLLRIPRHDVLLVTTFSGSSK